MGDTMGDGGDGGPYGPQYDIGYGTHFGLGNVKMPSKERHRFGYDKDGIVKTRGARVMAGFTYDPGAIVCCSPQMVNLNSYFARLVHETGYEIVRT